MLVVVNWALGLAPFDEDRSNGIMLAAIGLVGSLVAFEFVVLIDQML